MLHQAQMCHKSRFENFASAVKTLDTLAET